MTFSHILLRTPHIYLPKCRKSDSQNQRREFLILRPHHSFSTPSPLFGLPRRPFAALSSFEGEQADDRHYHQQHRDENKAADELPGMAQALHISSRTASGISLCIAMAALCLPLFMSSLGRGLPVQTRVLSYATLLFGFYMAWNIGANDVANAMGTSVGSGALTLRQAVVTAAVLEFSGALLMGTHVTSTMQKGILVADVFRGKDTLLFAGLLSSLAAAGTWLQVASYYGWPVSTTHCIVGSMVGFGLAYGGSEAVFWSSLARVTSSWVVSPLVGAMVSFLVYKCIRRCPKPGASGGSSRSSRRIFRRDGHFFCGLSSQPNPLNCPCPGSGLPPTRAATSVLSACFMSFAHGGNDVSNAIGPLAAALSILQGREAAAAEIVIPNDVLAWGGFGIVAGLMMWGYRVIATIGKKITELTPTRGFAAEFAAASVVLGASKLGLPISATHTLVGAVMGVGFARGLNSVRAETVREIVTSWVVTIPAGATFAVVYTWILTKLLSVVL
ncbi:phosphate transporter 2 [Striga asiatica]|uniref:Phosphate transporter n=1 Tax=Striga asiatica TaxID=4170 RepID=A0A5A7QQP3_STRAF|nr:phosphate transporter 2 [Striga asiatica]